MQDRKGHLRIERLESFGILMDPEIPGDLVPGSPAVIFPGGFDQHGCSLLIFPKSHHKHLVDLSIDGIEKFIKYILHLQKTQHFGSRLLSVVVDLRTAAAELITLIISSLLRVQHRLGGVIGTFYALQPGKRHLRKLLFKSLGLLRNKSLLEPPFKCVLIDDTFELFNFIDRSQLTSEFGGYLVYEHEHWVSFRKEIDCFNKKYAAVFERLPSCIASLQALGMSPLPSDRSTFIAFSRAVQSTYFSLRNEIGIDELYSKCNEIVQKLQKPNGNHYQAVSGPAMFQTLANMLSYRHRIKAAVDKIELLRQQALSKAQVSVENMECKREAQQVIEMISAQMEKMDSYAVRIGSSKTHAETFKEEYITNVHGPAMALIDRTDGVMASLGKLNGDKTKCLTSKLDKLKKRLSREVEIPLQMLTAICDYNILVKKAAWWYHLVLTQISFKNALQSGISPKLCFANSVVFIDRAWKIQVSSFLIHHSPPAPEELLRLCQLSARLSELHPEIQRQHATLLSQRCCVLIRLMTCNRQVQASDLHQAIYWQKNRAACDNKSFLSDNGQIGENIKPFSGICHSPNGFTKSEQVDSSFSQTAPAVNYPDYSTITAKGTPAVKKTVHNSLTFQSKAFQDVIKDMPPEKSLNYRNHGADQTIQQMVSHSNEEVPLNPPWSGQSPPSRTKKIGCLCLHNTLSALNPSISGNYVDSHINRKAHELLPKNPWLSLPLEDHGMSAEIIIRHSHLTTKQSNKGAICIVCSSHLKDQSAIPSVYKDVGTCKPLNSNSVEIQVNAGILKSVSSTLESAIQSDDGACYRMSKVENSDHKRSPAKMIVSSPFNRSLEQNEVEKDRIYGTDRHFDQHLPRGLMVECDKNKLSNGVEWLFSDWELKEQEELHDIENLLEKVENILWEEECVFEQERELDVLLKNEALISKQKNSMSRVQSRINNTDPAMSPKELSNSGVFGTEADGIQQEKLNYFSGTFVDRDRALVGPGCMFPEVNRVAPKPQHSSKLLMELKELYAIETKIWDENLKIEQLRELERRGKVKDHNSFLHQTKDRLSFLAELQRERIEVEKLEQSLAKEDLLKKRKVRKMPDINKIKSHHKHFMSKSSGIEASKPINPLVGALDAPNSRMCSRFKSCMGHNGGHDQGSHKAGMSDSVQATVLQIENKPVNQEEIKMVVLTSTACKQESRIVEGSECDEEEVSSSLSSIIKGNIRPPPSSFEDTNKYATDKLCGPIAKPRKAMVGKPCTPVLKKLVFPLCNNLKPEDHAIHEPLHICSAQGNLKGTKVNAEVTGNVSSLDLPKEDALPDNGSDPKLRSPYTSTPCKYQQENNNCSSSEKSVTIENDEVAHSSQDGLDLTYLITSTEGSLPQVCKKQEPLKDRANTICEHPNVADIHSSQSRPKDSRGDACLDLKEHEVRDSHENATVESCLKMPPKIPGLERSHFQVSSVKLSDFKTPVVLDVGSGLMKAGFAGHDLPITVFPPVVGFTKEKGTESTCFSKEIYVGHEAQHARSTLTLKYPMHHGNVTDWADLEQAEGRADVASGFELGKVQSTGDYHSQDRLEKAKKHKRSKGLTLSFPDPAFTRE
ncbi:hypothetical protein NDU88_004178 [Pleurodeles waltl]|uniref:Uncharacterized protein n=1 Tax=Pleurodeles waltl TaxID=8319 RepID=A0AAV7RFZ2_PLEWA|nr:hypothetical protein NDU88_004178 [Pleurodeles waltl]